MKLLKMKYLTIEIFVFNIYIFFNCGNSMSVEDLLSKSMEVFQPRHCVLWTNLFDGAISKSQYLTNNHLFLKILLNTTPASQISITKSVPFVSGTYFYNVSISAPIHYFYFIA